jgi:spore germination protein KC
MRCRREGIATKKLICVLLCIMMIMTLSGCWSKKEPKTLAIVNSIIYDISDDGTYHTTAEIMNPSAAGGAKEGSGNGKSPAIIVVSEGMSAPEAVRNLSESSERRIFGGHNNVRFFSERLAKKDIVSIIDYLLRDNLTDETPLMVVIKGEDPEQIYSCTVGLSDMVGDYIDSLSKSQPKATSKSVFVTTLDFIKDYYNDGKQPVAGVAELAECETKPSGNTETGSQNPQGSQSNSGKTYKIKYDGLAAFKNNKLVGYMDGVEARAYNFVTNNIKTAFVSIPSGEDVTVVMIRTSKSNIKTTVENGQATIDVRIKIGIDVIQENGLIDVSKIEPLKIVEENFDKQMGKEIATSIKKAQQEFQSDIFGFGSVIHIQHPETWKEIKRSWDDYFSKASIYVTVESSADRSGNIKEPFKMED